MEKNVVNVKVERCPWRNYGAFTLAVPLSPNTEEGKNETFGELLDRVKKILRENRRYKVAENLLEPYTYFKNRLGSEYLEDSRVLDMWEKDWLITMETDDFLGTPVPAGDTAEAAPQPRPGTTDQHEPERDLLPVKEEPVSSPPSSPSQSSSSGYQPLSASKPQGTPGTPPTPSASLAPSPPLSAQRGSSWANNPATRPDSQRDFSQIPLPPTRTTPTSGAPGTPGTPDTSPIKLDKVYGEFLTRKQQHSSLLGGDGGGAGESVGVSGGGGGGGYRPLSHQAAPATQARPTLSSHQLPSLAFYTPFSQQPQPQPPRTVRKVMPYLELDVLENMQGHDVPSHLTAKNVLLNYYQVLLGRELPPFTGWHEGADHLQMFYAEVDVTDLVTAGGTAAASKKPTERIIGYGKGRKKTLAENLAAVDAVLKLRRLGVSSEQPAPPTTGYSNPKVALNEVFQYYYGQPPKFMTKQLGDGTVEAELWVENKRFVKRGFSKAKATQAVAREALLFLDQRQRK